MQKFLGLKIKKKEEKKECALVVFQTERKIFAQRTRVELTNNHLKDSHGNRGETVHAGSKASEDVKQTGPIYTKSGNHAPN